MKIVTTSNFDLETYAESEVAVHIKSEAYANAMLKGLRDTVYEGDLVWFKLVKDDYRCWRGMYEFADYTEEKNQFLDEEIGL